VTRLPACTLILALGAAPCLDAQARTSKSVGRNSEHPPDTRAGTLPCGYPGSGCTPPEAPHHHDDTGRNIAIGAGLGVLLGVSIAGLARNSPAAAMLNEHGPQFPDLLHESALHVTGFVHGGWPLVVDYEPAAGSYVVMIGIGTAVARRPLPHHRAYGSVHGGSSRLRRHFFEQ
jgi:hypothetical protein